MRTWQVDCISLAEMGPGATLASALAQPNFTVWRRLSFGAAHDALKLGQTPTLQRRPMDAEHAHVAAALRPIREQRARIAALVTKPEFGPLLLSEVEPLLGPEQRPPLVPLVPLSSCARSCGGRGWCELVHGRAQCGCFVAGGLLRGAGFGGPMCEGEHPRARPHRRPADPAVGGAPHWGPACPGECSGRGVCDWQGFCKCDDGFWGLDCAIQMGASGRPEFAERAPRLVGALGLKQRGRRSGLQSARPRVYVLDLPPVYRFGVDFARQFEDRLHERFRASVHRTADIQRADFVYMPGPPLVIDGHRLLARLWYARERSPLWKLAGSPGAALAGARFAASATAPSGQLSNFTLAPLPGLARHMMCLLTERGAMDSFQLSYSDDDREEWPAIAHEPYALGLTREWAARTRAGVLGGHDPGSPSQQQPVAALARTGSYHAHLDCGVPWDPQPPGLLASPDADARLDALLRLAEGSSERAGGKTVTHRQRALAELVHLLGEATEWRFNVLGRPLLRGLFGRGVMKPTAALAARSCELPDDLRPDSRARRWLGLQFNGGTTPPVSFMRGVDIALPQLLLLSGGGSHADQPSCDMMRQSSPHSPHFDRHELHRRRSTLLWFGGHHGHGGARTQIFRLYGGDGKGGGGAEPGFVLIDSLAGGARRSAINMSLSSVFCWVPRGQGEGDPTRHMVAIFHGCVPVFSLGREGADDALPFEEVIDWRQISLRVPKDRLQELPNTLWAAVEDSQRLAAMQRRLGCAWRQLFWSSLVGSCFGEPTDDEHDAFGALTAVLRLRIERMDGHAAVLPPLGGHGGCEGVPIAVSSTEPAPGATEGLLLLRPTVRSSRHSRWRRFRTLSSRMMRETA